MTGTDKDERCWCPREGKTCPHCGRRQNSDQRARCHREAAGGKPAVIVDRRLFRLYWLRGRRRPWRREKYENAGTEE